MRNRDARASHAVESNFATGSFSNRLSPTSWPTGGNEIWCEVVIAGTATITLDTSMDYRDRHLILSGQFMEATPPDYVVPNGIGPTNKSNSIYPRNDDATFDMVGIFNGDMFYTSQGWDGTTQRFMGLVNNNNYAQPRNPNANELRALFLWVNPFSGALTLSNGSGAYYQGVLHVKASPQLNALVSVP